jgi:hypothetical protein
MSFERHDEQQRFLAALNRRAAAGQIDRRGFLRAKNHACIDDLLDGRYLGGAD